MGQALASAGYYQQDKMRAKAIIEKVIEIVSDWEHQF
jgi:serine/threonine-protein kinase HipA